MTRRHPKRAETDQPSPATNLWKSSLASTTTSLGPFSRDLRAMVSNTFDNIDAACDRYSTRMFFYFAWPTTLPCRRMLPVV